MSTVVCWFGFSFAPPKKAKALRCNLNQVSSFWSNTNSTYMCRLQDSVMTKAQARRNSPVSGSMSEPAKPKSTCPSSPGLVSIRTTTSGVDGSRVPTKRRTEE